MPGEVARELFRAWEAGAREGQHEVILGRALGHVYFRQAGRRAAGGRALWAPGLTRARHIGTGWPGPWSRPGMPRPTLAGKHKDQLGQAPLQAFAELGAAGGFG